MSALGRVIGASPRRRRDDLTRLGITPLRRPVRLPRSRRAAWVLAVVGPALIILGSWPFQSALGLGGVLFCMLIVVVAVAGIGGVQPALMAVVVGFLAGVVVFSQPFGSLPFDRAVDLVALVAFVVVGTAVGVLVDDLTRLADEQAALRRVATLVAREAPPGELIATVTAEVKDALPVDVAAVGRYEADGTVTLLAKSTKGGDDVPAGVLTGGGQNVGTLASQTRHLDGLDGDDRSPTPTGAAGDAAFRSSVRVPIVVNGRLWGVLAVASIEHLLGPDAEALLASFTDLLATGIANTETRAALAASRARIVAAADETRRQIERNLHDGAQQRLVSLGLELRAAQTAVPPELGELEGELSQVVEGLGAVLDELREIARGIHPAILAEGGLGPALKTLARRSPVPVELDVRTQARLGERVEVATYYVVSETLTNAAKHAHASVVVVDVEAVDSDLRVSVRDDGVGGADPTRGSGLVGLKDRIEALGGTITVESPAGAGTVVHVELPLDT